MKKIILHSFLCAICFAFITSCSKDVKAPSTQTKNPAVTKTTTSTTQTQTNNHSQNGHDCGNHSSQSGGGGY
ncbi:MAG TPA: hypothetical protein VH396_04510 [Chitinophagaceae bacterium]|jgi:hypothetical protein